MENVLVKFNKQLNRSVGNIGSYSGIYFVYLYSSMLELLELTSPDILDESYEDWLKEEDKNEGEWFRLFHKRMRQCGSFNGFKKSTLIPSTLTDVETARLKELLKMRSEKVTKVLETYEFGSDEYKRADVELFIANKEWLRELRDLNQKKSHYEDERVDGHLDGILYNLIHADDNNSLFIMLNHFFEDLRDETERGNLLVPRIPVVRDRKYVEEN